MNFTRNVQKRPLNIYQTHTEIRLPPYKHQYAAKTYMVSQKLGSDSVCTCVHVLLVPPVHNSMDDTNMAINKQGQTGEDLYYGTKSTR